MIRGVIWDVDGTLLDSMPIWDDVGARYLISIGIEPEPGLGEILFTMSLEEGVDYLKSHYHLPQTPEQIRDGVLGVIGRFYRDEVQMKPGIRELINAYDADGIPMTIATTSDRELITAAFERLGIADCFGRIFTATELHTTKKEPLIYLTAAEYMGSVPEETMVYEDVLHAVRTAKGAGFQVGAVEDDASADDWEEIRELVDVIVGQ